MNNPTPLESPPSVLNDPAAPSAPETRAPFIYAAAGAFLASAYWAVLALLLVSRAHGRTAIGPLGLQCVLVVLYAIRGIQIYKGEPRAVKRILWLHAIGAVAAVSQVISGQWVVLQSVKILIHLFGGIAAISARRALARRSPRSVAASWVSR